MGQVIRHIGTKRHSGRYPWGSGNDPYQRSITLLSYVEELRKEGITSKAEIAKALNMKTIELVARQTLAVAEKRAADVTRAIRLKDSGMSNTAIGREMGINESTVRSLLNPVLQERANSILSTAKILRDNVDQKRFVDVGAGIEQQLGVTRTKMNAAVIMLKDEGYPVYYSKFQQQGTEHKTSMRILGAKDSTFDEYKEAKNNNQIKMIDSYTEDNGLSWAGIEPPRSISRKRVFVRYAEDGGTDKDGLIELRRGVPDIALGKARYAQVRMSVDGQYYMKGMAIHSRDIPDGYDVVYNVNKKKGTPDGDVFKKIKGEDNPFGAVIRQKRYIDETGQSQLSALNIVGSPRVPGSGEEGSWKEWSRTISSQVLSKQSRALAKKQLAEDLSRRQEEYEEIMSLTNPSVKKRLLESFGDNCDAAAVHLKAAALPRQASHVLIPVPSMKPNEVYAPNYNDGEIVVLIRHPHGGTFEIPQLVVNNKNREAQDNLGRDASDAIGIHPKVAAKLSGADFDGDTVLVIPNNNGQIDSKPALRGLADFDHRTQYKKFEGMPVMTAHQKAMEMGNISNLITDMTIRGADDNEIARAVRHSMVVIDAEKHELNYKQSAIDNNISQLKAKYQGRADAGASTLISRASSKKIVNQRKINYRNIDPATGRRIYEDTGETYVKTGEFLKDKRTGKYIIDPETGERVRKIYKTPKTITRKQTSTKMAEETDAFNLSSGTRMEAIYAEHANALKALGNRSRKSSIEIEDIPYSPSAREVYGAEVKSLQYKLNLAYRNKPYERQAQLLASKEIAARIRENPDMDDDHIKKIKGQALDAARVRVGAKKPSIEILDREWEAIQAGAISTNRLREILLNTDLDAIKQRSMPRNSSGLSPARTLRARTMRNNGSTTAEIAQALGVSTSTIDRALDK